MSHAGFKFYQAAPLTNSNSAQKCRCWLWSVFSVKLEKPVTLQGE